MNTGVARLAASLERTLAEAIGEGAAINEDRIRQIVREELHRHRMEGTLDAEQAGAFLGVSRNMVYELSISGELPYSWVGKQKRFRIAALEAYLEKNEVNSIAVG